MTWPVVKLGDICRPRQHKTIPASEMHETGYVVYGANGPIGYYSDFTHDRTTIAVTCRGATCGTINIVPPMSYITGNAMALDDLDESRVDLKFLAYALEKIGFSSVINGAAQPQITRAPLLTYEIPLPPLEEQKRIAAILDQVDALRRLRARALTRLGALGQAIFHEMFGDPVTNPMNWPKRPIGELCSRVSVGVVVKPASYYQDDGVPAIRGTNIKTDGIDLDDLVYFSKEASNGPLRKSRLNTGDLIAVRSGRPGLSAVVPPELDGANCIDVLIATTIPELLSSLYLRDFINSSGGKKLVLAESRGQVQQHFNVKSMSEGEIILPPIENQLQYVERLAKLSEAKLAASVADYREQTLFTSLQHRAFRGEL